MGGDGFNTGIDTSVLLKGIEYEFLIRTLPINPRMISLISYLYDIVNVVPRRRIQTPLQKIKSLYFKAFGVQWHVDIGVHCKYVTHKRKRIEIITHPSIRQAFRVCVNNILFNIAIQQNNMTTLR